MFSSMILWKDWLKEPSWHSIIPTLAVLLIGSLAPKLIPAVWRFMVDFWNRWTSSQNHGSVLLVDSGESLTTAPGTFQDAVLQYVRVYCAESLRSVTSKRGISKFDPASGQRYYDLIFEPDEPVLVPFDGHMVRVTVDAPKSHAQTVVGGSSARPTGSAPARASTTMRLTGPSFAVLRAFLMHCQADVQRRAATEHGLLLFGCDREDRSGTGSPWVAQAVTVAKTYQNVFLDGKADVFARVNAFLTSKSFYERHGQPYKHTLLLSGAPGTGKTSLVFALARHCQRNLYWFGRETDPTRLRALVDCIPAHSLVVFDDLDIKFDLMDRGAAHSNASEAVGEQPLRHVSLGHAAARMPFDDVMMPPFLYTRTRPPDSDRRREMLASFLEVLDGYNYLHGCLVVITTNVPQAFDRAVFRHGRVDQRVHLGPCSAAVLREMLAWYFPDVVLSAEQQAVVDSAADRFTSARLLCDVFAPLAREGDGAAVDCVLARIVAMIAEERES
jgi:hypothetical protein